jgi:hypothetical protein
VAKYNSTEKRRFAQAVENIRILSLAEESAKTLQQ